MPVSAATYEQLALEDPEGKWELVCGRLRHKPAMTTEHEDTVERLYRTLARQLPAAAFALRSGSRLRRPNGQYFVPDLFVVPRALSDHRRTATPRTLDAYDDPVPLVVEVWSPSTGDYDIADKLPGYQARGDAEIWRLHPYEHTLTRWLRQPDGAYREERVTAAQVEPAALPGVTITISELFA